jgi:hypothetical protein
VTQFQFGRQITDVIIRRNAQQRVPEKHLYRFANGRWKLLEHLSLQSAKAIIAESRRLG